MKGVKDKKNTHIFGSNLKKGIIQSRKKVDLARLLRAHHQPLRESCFNTFLLPRKNAN